MKSYNIALIPGDGTGPEVLAEGVKVVNAACAKYGVKLNYQSFDFGGERYKRTGEILPDSALEEFKKFDSIFLGAIGHPDVKPGILEVGILLKTRFALDQYINLRPVKREAGICGVSCRYLFTMPLRLPGASGRIARCRLVVEHPLPPPAWKSDLRFESRWRVQHSGPVYSGKSFTGVHRPPKNRVTVGAEAR